MFRHNTFWMLHKFGHETSYFRVQHGLGHYTFSYVTYVRIENISYPCVVYVPKLHIPECNISLVKYYLLFVCVAYVRALHILVAT